MKKAVNFTIDDREINRLVKTLSRYGKRARPIMRRVVEDTLFDVHRMAITEAPVSPDAGAGSLRRSIRIEKQDDLRGIVAAGGTSKVDYARHVEFGTKAHYIRPRRKKLLRFKNKQGEIVFAKLVAHPGTKAQPFMQKTAEQSKPKLIRRMKQEIIKARK